MENNKLTSGEEGLAIIQAMINKAKHQFGDNGHLYLMWGWVVLFCALAQFALLNYFHFPQHYLVWMLTWAAVIYQQVYISRRNKKRIVKTYTEDILGYVWLVFVVLMFMFGYLFATVLGKDTYRLINPAFLVLYGMPTFLSGIILKFRPLIIGAVSCWILAIFAGLVNPEYHMLFLALGVIIAWIIPGYIMRSRFKKQQIA